MEQIALKQTVLHYTGLSKDQADRLLQLCLDTPTTHTMGGRYIVQFGQDYIFSGRTFKATPIPEWLAQVIQQVNQKTGQSFNAVLMNIYPAGSNVGIGFHADDEPELGPDPVVASISLGADCKFELRATQSDERVSMVLEHGDFLVMGKGCQKHYRHGIQRIVMPATRVSLTFRHVL